MRGIHRSPVNSPHKGQWRGALIFSLICVWTNGWVNNREAGDLRCQCGRMTQFHNLSSSIANINLILHTTKTNDNKDFAFHLATTHVRLHVVYIIWPLDLRIKNLKLCITYIIWQDLGFKLNKLAMENRLITGIQVHVFGCYREVICHFKTYCRISSISPTKSQYLNVSCIPVQLSSLNPLKPGVKLRRKM